MSWIRTIPFETATGKLKQLYERVAGTNNNVDNIMLAHSLRPHSMEGHMALYKNVLHNSRNRLPKSYLETIGVYVSHLNNCRYCVEHHFAGLKRLVKDDVRSDEIREALTKGQLTPTFDGRDLAGLRYAKKLSTLATEMCEGDIAALRDAGFDDGEILEINQVTAYFSYANRTVLGLGVRTGGDIIGLSPNDSDDPGNWNHS